MSVITATAVPVESSRSKGYEPALKAFTLMDVMIIPKSLIVMFWPLWSSVIPVELTFKVVVVLLAPVNWLL